MTFDVKNETIGHLYGTSILRCNFFFRMKNTVSDNEKINKMTEIRLFCHIS
jgi:hypothetical protein